MENLNQKAFIGSKFHYHRNKMIYFMKIYTTNHSHYHRLVPNQTGRKVITTWIDLTKRYVFASVINLQKLSDCNSLETICQKVGAVEVHPISCTSLWCWDGHACIHPYCILLLVSFYVNIPNKAHVQPGVQPRFGNISHPCRKQP